MMLTVGIDPGDCLNYKTCGVSVKLSPEEEIEIIRMREEENRRWQESVRTTRRQAARIMLMSRGCPQTTESLGITKQVAELTIALEHLQNQLSLLSGQYIAPPECEAHR